MSFTPPGNDPETVSAAEAVLGARMVPDASVAWTAEFPSHPAVTALVLKS